MTWADRFTLFSSLDFVGLAFVIISWAIVGWVIENPPTHRPSVSMLMGQYRREWMTQMTTRQPRIFDAQIIGSLRQGTAFFASTSMLAIGGTLALVGNGEELIRQMRYTLYLRDVKNLEGISETGIVNVGIDAIFESRDRVGLKIIQEREKLLNSFTLGNGLEIQKGNYRDRKISLSARTNQSRGYWGNFNFSKGDYFGGNKTSWNTSIGRQFSNHLTLYGSANQNIIFMPNQGEFTANIYGFTAEVALNREWFGKALIQYDNFSNQLQLYCRINWIHTPGSDLFIVINRLYDMSGNNNSLVQNTQVVKLTYLFQI